MKNRPSERQKVSDLDTLNAQLDEVRAEARRLANVREATERKLASIGNDLNQLRAELEKNRAAKPRGKKC